MSAVSGVSCKKCGVEITEENGVTIRMSGRVIPRPYCIKCKFVRKRWIRTNLKKCGVIGCTNKYLANGWCRFHRYEYVTRVENLRIRQLVFDVYGHSCKCCGEDHDDFLAIDHIYEDGAAHRKKIGPSRIYRWLIKNNFPGGFQVLCFNCNWAKSRVRGGCPHERERNLLLEEQMSAEYADDDGEERWVDIFSSERNHRQLVELEKVS